MQFGVSENRNLEFLKNQVLELEYLGHRISKEGVSMVPEYTQTIKEGPVSKMGKKVATFLGFAGYYRMFIPPYSSLTNRLKRIKKAGFNFTIVHKKGQENSNTDVLSWSTHMAEARPLEEDELYWGAFPQDSLRTRGLGVQDYWDLWLNASMFAYNTTMSSSTVQSFPHCL